MSVVLWGHAALRQELRLADKPEKAPAQWFFSYNHQWQCPGSKAIGEARPNIVFLLSSPTSLDGAVQAWLVIERSLHTEVLGVYSCCVSLHSYWCRTWICSGLYTHFYKSKHEEEIGFGRWAVCHLKILLLVKFQQRTVSVKVKNFISCFKFFLQHLSILSNTKHTNTVDVTWNSPFNNSEITLL